MAEASSSSGAGAADMTPEEVQAAEALLHSMKDFNPVVRLPALCAMPTHRKDDRPSRCVRADTG